tara:strand:+ start:1737 stop:2156 length:420 start_codon:yes stop_codon:yes gene_type:complete
MGGIASNERDEDDEYPFIMQRAMGKIENKIPFDAGGTHNPQTSNIPLTVPLTLSQDSQLTNDSVVNSIISQFAERSRVGLEKYGTTLDRTDLSILDWVQHAQEEMMDGILYLEKIKKTIIESSITDAPSNPTSETMKRQ